MSLKVQPDGIQNYKNYLDEFIKLNINEDNQEQVLYLERKVKDSIKLAKKCYEKEGLAFDRMNVTIVYFIIFYFRLLENNGELKPTEEVESPKEVKNAFVINKKELYRTFKLEDKDKAQLTNAFEDHWTPIHKNYLMAIKIGHDVITSLFGSKKITKKINELIDEIDFYFPSSVDNLETYKKILEYMSQTRYFSKYIKENYLLRKLKNKNKLVKHIQKLKTDSSIINNKIAMTMIKTSSRNQVDLVSIADKKAGIMITVNSILLTILIPLFASYIFDFSSYIVPIIVLAVTCGVTILLATLATRPTARVQNEHREDKLVNGDRSIFYFKNFAKLSKEKFADDIHDLLKKDSAFEKAIFTDLYDVGIDLERKYIRLRWCYTVFGSGIILTMLSFIFCIFYFNFN